MHLFGSIEPPLLVQFLLRLSYRNNITSPSAVSSFEDSNLSGRATIDSLLDLTIQQTESVQHVVVDLIDEAFRGIRMLAPPISRPAITAASTQEIYTAFDPETLRLWDLNCPPASEEPKHGLALQLEEAAVALAELSPSCVPQINTSVSECWCFQQTKARKIQNKRIHCWELVCSLFEFPIDHACWKDIIKQGDGLNENHNNLCKANDTTPCTMACVWELGISCTIWIYKQIVKFTIQPSCLHFFQSQINNSTFMVWQATRKRGLLPKENA